MRLTKGGGITSNMLQWCRSDAGFFPCPLPIHNFVLATWMNETFWTPAETDLYLQSEP